MSVESMTPRASPAPSRFTERTIIHNLYPLWEQTSLHQTGQPQPEAPCAWKWDDVQPLIDEAVQSTSTASAERRVLLMANPAYAQAMGAAKLQTTVTLQGALQILMPGESARAHRHTPNALRFMLEDGGETYTVVDGKECLMERGDVILTPTNTWHSHYHKGSKRSVWFDALDSGLSGYFDAAFFDPAAKLAGFPPTISDASFVSTGLSPLPSLQSPSAYSPRFRFPWADTLAALQAAPAREDGSVWLRFTNPAGGAMAMPPMDSFMVRLPRQATQPHRTTASAMCAVALGSGVSTFGDQEVRWKENDIFTIPHWQWATHRAESENAVLFMVTDRGALENLGFLRDEFE